MIKSYFKSIFFLVLLSGFFISWVVEKKSDSFTFSFTITTLQENVLLVFNTISEQQSSINIDWGNGNKDNLLIQLKGNRGEESISHYYRNDSKLPHTITVRATHGVILKCENNQLTSLNVSGNLIELSCYQNNLTSLDFSRIECIQGLYCARNQLSNIDVSKNQELSRLTVNFNQLTSLNVSNNVILKSLSCSNNQLTSLYLNNNTELEGLECSNNQLRSLYLNNNTELEELVCGNNQLTNLDISKNIKLRRIQIHNNLMDTQSLNSFLNSLPVIDRQQFREGFVNIIGNPGASTCDHSIAINKGWMIVWK